MAGTRTAPAVTGSVTSVTITLHLIDASGDIYTDALTFVSAPSAANIETMVAAYQAATQASVYKVTQSSEWAGNADPANAEVGQRNSIKDGINILYKNLTTLNTQTPRLVAPIAGVMSGNLDIPVLTSTELAALITAQEALLTGYDIQSGQFTERRERSNNPRIKA